MVFEFGNNLGWFAFLALVPLIIIYLIRPRPVNLKVPSLMFFVKRANISRATSLFRRFQNDFLFLLQLFALLLLIFSITEPSLVLERDVVSGNIVFVLDVSASSQVKEGEKIRLDMAKEKIKELATSENSLILLKSSPIIALENVGRSELVRFLDRVQSTDDTSDIAATIMLAGDMLANTKGRIVVASDFIESKGVDADLAKNVLESRGIGVDFVDIKTDLRNNVGIVDMVISGEDVNLYVKNYNNVNKKITLKINDQESKINVAGGAVEPYTFSVKSNLTEAEILEDDDFLVDNKVLITRPYPDLIKVLWVTNKPSKFLGAALNSIDGVSVTKIEPPIIPKGEFDIYVFSDVDREKIIVDTFGNIFRKVRDKGKSAIVVAQKDSDKIDYEGLLPNLGKLVEGGVSSIDQINRFTKDIEFDKIKNVFEFTKENSIVSVGNNSIISIFNVEDGRVFYYGILEDENDFKITPSYPVFWNNLIGYLIGKGNLNDVNLKTGFVLEIANETKTLDRTGIYKLKDISIAVNLLNERESDINFVDTETSAEFVKVELETIKSKVDYRFDLYLVAVVLLILLFEFIYIKYRGEI